MSTVIETVTIAEPCSARTLDFSSIPLFNRINYFDLDLLRRLDLHKWLKSEKAGKDIGYEAAVVGYFTDNPSQLLDLFPDVADLSNQRRAGVSNCYPRIAQVTSILLPLAIADHKCFMEAHLRHSGQKIGDEEALEDFRTTGFINDWLKREIVAAYLCLSDHPEYNSSFQMGYKDLQRRQAQGLELIQTSTRQLQYANRDNYRAFFGISAPKKGLTFLLAEITKA